MKVRIKQRSQFPKQFWYPFHFYFPACVCVLVCSSASMCLCVFRIVRQLSLNAMAMMVILFPIKLAMIG